MHDSTFELLLYVGVEGMVTLGWPRAEAEALSKQLSFAVMLQGRSGWAAISPSAKRTGAWQLTWFDEDGVGGDTIRDTAAECAALALREGYTLTKVVGPAADAGERLMARAAEARAQLLREIEEVFGV